MCVSTDSHVDNVVPAYLGSLHPSEHAKTIELTLVSWQSTWNISEPASWLVQQAAASSAVKLNLVTENFGRLESWRKVQTIDSEALAPSIVSVLGDVVLRNNLAILALAVESPEEGARSVACGPQSEFALGHHRRGDQAILPVISLPFRPMFLSYKPGKIAKLFQGAPRDLHEQVGKILPNLVTKRSATLETATSEKLENASQILEGLLRHSERN